MPINAESFENLILPLTSIQKIQLYQTLDDPNYSETILEWQGCEITKEMIRTRLLERTGWLNDEVKYY